MTPSYTDLPLTVLAITFNEAERLPGLLDCVAGWAAEVFIVDSGSTDDTVDIALDHGANVVQRRFTSFSDQWNFAARELPIETPWSIKLDPDERLSEDLKREIGAALSDADELAGFYMHRRLWFMGERLHATTDGTLRIWRTGRASFGSVKVNEHARVEGPCGRISTPIEHIDSASLHHWFEKQNRMTTMEADRLHLGGELTAEPKLFGDSLQRRMWIKEKFFSIPGRYALFWLYLWLRKGAWRDGATGRAWVTLRVSVMRMTELKAVEMGRVGSYSELAVEDEERRLDPRIAESPLQKRLDPPPP